jgi:hypothetical protein
MNIKLKITFYRLKSVDEMCELGLFLNDLNSFDGTCEMLVTELQHNNQLQKAIEKVSKEIFFF